MTTEQPGAKQTTRTRASRSDTSRGVRAAETKSRRQVSRSAPATFTGGPGLAIAGIVRDVVHARLNAVADIADALYGSTPTFIESPLASFPVSRVASISRLAQRITSPLSSSSPSTVKEEADAYIVTFEVPGWRREDLDIRVDPTGLRISGERPTRISSGPGMEQDAVQVLDLSWTAPDDVDPTDAKASLADGVLEVALPKAEELRGRQVPIN